MFTGKLYIRIYLTIFDKFKLINWAQCATLNHFRLLLIDDSVFSEVKRRYIGLVSWLYIILRNHQVPSCITSCIQFVLENGFKGEETVLIL